MKRVDVPMKRLDVPKEGRERRRLRRRRRFPFKRLIGEGREGSYAAAIVDEDVDGGATAIPDITHSGLESLVIRRRREA